MSLFFTFFVYINSNLIRGSFYLVARCTSAYVGSNINGGIYIDFTNIKTIKYKRITYLNNDTHELIIRKINTSNNTYLGDIVSKNSLGTSGEIDVSSVTGKQWLLLSVINKIIADSFAIYEIELS